MSDIDWSKAPEGYPIWIEALVDDERSDWHRDDGDQYTDEHGCYWTKPEEGFYVVHRRPIRTPEYRAETIKRAAELCGFKRMDYIFGVLEALYDNGLLKGSDDQ